MKGSSQRDMSLGPLSLGLVYKHNQSIERTLSFTIGYHALCSLLGNHEEQKQEGLTLHQIRRVPARPPLDVIIVFTSEALVDGGRFCGPPWSASHRTSSPPTAFFAVVRRRRFNDRSRDAISAARRLLHGCTTGSLSPGLASTCIAVIGGRPLAGAGGGPEAALWRLWRRSGWCPLATHAGDDEGGGGAPKGRRG